MYQNCILELLVKRRNKVPRIQTILLHVSWCVVKLFVLHNQNWRLNWVYKHLLHKYINDVCLYIEYAVWQFQSHSLIKTHFTRTTLKLILKYATSVTYNWNLYVESNTKSVCLFLCFGNIARIFPFDFIK